MPSDVTQLLVQWSSGDHEALDRLTPMVYDELWRMAKVRLSREGAAAEWQPTALVHEAYLKLIGHTRLRWQNRAHFYAIAATTMRRILIDDARRRKAEKRGGAIQITVNENVDAAHEKPFDILALDLALQSLEQMDKRKARVIELKYFGGLTAEEISHVTDLSLATVGRDLRLAQAWLHRELAGNPE